MGVKVTNNAYGTLSAGIASGDTTITLDGGQGARFPTLGAGDYFYGTLVDTGNNIEVVKVTARSSDSMTVERGADNTTARAYAIGDRFELRPTAALFDAIQSEAEANSIPITGGTATGDVLATNLGTQSPSSIDDATLNPGFYKVSTGATGNPVSGNSGTLLILPSAVSGGGQGQMYIRSNNTEETRAFVRHQANSYNSGAYRNWREIVTTSGETAQLESTPKFCVYADTGTGNGWLMSGTGGTFAACDTVVTNIGSGYSVANNRFTAPVAGTYHFTVNMSLHGTDGTLADNSLGYGFLKNGAKLEWNSYDGGLNNVWSASNFTASNAIEISGPHVTAIITLAQNDYIQFGWQNMSKPMGVRAMVFSGFLIG